MFVLLPFRVNQREREREVGCCVLDREDRVRVVSEMGEVRELIANFIRKFKLLRAPSSLYIFSRLNLFTKFQ